jgi:hypothetical protein
LAAGAGEGGARERSADHGRDHGALRSPEGDRLGLGTAVSGREADRHEAGDALSEDPHKALLEHVERIVRDMEARLVKKLDENMEAANALAARKQGAAERQRRFRERGPRSEVTSQNVTPVTSQNVTRGSLKALDLSTQDQDLDQRSQRNVTKRHVTSPTHAVWQAYAEAYERRYGTKPIRNASVNGKLARVVQRLGDEAPEVAAFFVTHPGAFYATRGHPVGLLLVDAEKLRTEWATARPITGTEARQQEKTAANMGGWERMLKREPDAVG